MTGFRPMSPVLTTLFAGALLIGGIAADLVGTGFTAEVAPQAVLLTAVVVSVSTASVRMLRGRWDPPTLALIGASLWLGLVGVIGPGPVLRSEVSYLLWGIGAVVHSRSAVVAGGSPRRSGRVMLTHGALMAAAGAAFAAGTGVLSGGLLGAFGVAQIRDPDRFSG